MDRRVWLALALLLAGGAALVVDQSRAGTPQLWGLLAVLLATLAWGADNTLSRPLAERDPGQVVLAKAVLGSTATGRWPGPSANPCPAPPPHSRCWPWAPPATA